MTYDVGSERWLAAESVRLVDFARRSAHPDGGFGWLDADGRLDLDQPVQLWITCRMTHVFALAHLHGVPDVLELVEHGVEALRGGAARHCFVDRTHGGWFSSVGGAQSTAQVPTDTDKSAYDHAFVLLAAASAATVGARGGQELLADASRVLRDRFWDDSEGMVVERWDRDWQAAEPYRGVNSNMHTTEAFLAVYAVTGEPEWRDRALGIVSRVFEWARGNEWRIPEHFDADWRPLPQYNLDEPAHPFRPYGATVGHALEWARLALHLRAAYGAQAPAFLLADAQTMFAAAVADGWAVDGADGFVYTTDWDGKAVVRDRMHWVLAEAISTASTLGTVTGEPSYQRWQEALWRYADRYLIDHERGSWRHQLDEHNQPCDTVWAGKPDVYHALQATVIPRSALAASVAAGSAKAGAA